jgi:ATP-binding cassette subfamily B protein
MDGSADSEFELGEAAGGWCWVATSGSLGVQSGVRSILTIFLRHRGKVALGVVCLLVTDGAQLTIPLVVKGVIDRLAGESATRAWLGEQALLLCGLAAIVAAFRFAWRHFFFSTARLAELDLRNRILDHALSLKSRFFNQTRTGEFMALATNDVESVRQAIAMGFVAGFDGSVYALVGIAAMFRLDPLLALLTILPLPLLAVLMALSLKAVYNRWDAVQAAFEGLAEKTRESVAGMRVLRAYGRAAENSADFERGNEEYFRKYMRYVTVDALFHPAVLLLAGSCVAILLGAGGLRVMEGRTSIGSFVAFTSYLGMLTWPMIAAGWMVSLVQRAAASMDRINHLLEIRDTEQGESRRHSGLAAPIRGRIEAKNLTFSFPGQERAALLGVSFLLEPGESLGVVGQVGAGKSALAQLVCRLHDPPAGSLMVDGKDVLDFPLETLRSAVAYVPQEAFLFSDTIAENLRMGNPRATQEEMERVCKLASLHDEILSFPRGYETLLGERGVTLSGGQKQRLCLARALLKEAPILVLDDTLSAVDADVERRILAGLSGAVQNRTLIVISHRVSAVRDLMRILCLEDGKVIQSGTHDELSAVPGFYQRMVELQEVEE